MTSGSIVRTCFCRYAYAPERIASPTRCIASVPGDSAITRARIRNP